MNPKHARPWRCTHQCTWDQSRAGPTIAASNGRDPDIRQLFYCFSGALFDATAKLDESRRAETSSWARLARRPWLSDESADGQP